MTARLPARDVGVRRRVVRHTVGARRQSIGFARGGRGFARHTGQDSARQDGAGQPQMRVTEPHCRGDRAAVQSGRLQSEQMPVQRPCCRPLDRRGTDRLPRCPLHADDGTLERRRPAGEHAVRRQVHFPGCAGLRQRRLPGFMAGHYVRDLRTFGSDGVPDPGFCHRSKRTVRARCLRRCDGRRARTGEPVGELRASSGVTVVLESRILRSPRCRGRPFRAVRLRLPRGRCMTCPRSRCPEGFSGRM